MSNTIQDSQHSVYSRVEKDRDLIIKNKEKENADKLRGAKENKIKVEDKVFITFSCLCLHKVIPNYDTNESNRRRRFYKIISWREELNEKRKPC